MEIRAARANAKECIYLSQTEPELYVGPGFSGRAGFGLKFVKMFQGDFGLACTSFLYHSKYDFFLS